MQKSTRGGRKSNIRGAKKKGTLEREISEPKEISNKRSKTTAEIGNIHY